MAGCQPPNSPIRIQRLPPPRTADLRRLLAICGGLTSILLVPLGLAGPTAWLLLPAHLGLTVLAALGAALEGLTGHPERARFWGFGYLVATLTMVGTLEAASLIRGATTWYWAAPWAAALLWGWLPPLVAGLAGAFGESRRRALVRRVRRRRHRVS